MKTISIFALACSHRPCRLRAHDELNGSVHQVSSSALQSRISVSMSTEIAPINQAGTAWVDVKFAEALADGTTTAIALLPPYLRVEQGDRVEMRFAGGDGGRSDAALDPNRVTALLQKDGTPLGPAARKHLVPSEDQSRPMVGL
jgi:hypothetical protein